MNGVILLNRNTTTEHTTKNNSSKENIMGRITIQALVINSSNFNRFNVERIKPTKRTRKRRKERWIESKITNQKHIPIILAYSVNRIKEK